MGNWPVSPSRIPACNEKLEFSDVAKRCSTRIWGTQLHRFPEYDSGGSATDAREVGESGAKNRPSCPATTEVFAQSRRTVPVRKRSMPIVTRSEEHTSELQSLRHLVCRL